MADDSLIKKILELVVRVTAHGVDKVVTQLNALKTVITELNRQKAQSVKAEQKAEQATQSSTSAIQKNTKAEKENEVAKEKKRRGREVDIRKENDLKEIIRELNSIIGKSIEGSREKAAAEKMLIEVTRELNKMVGRRTAEQREALKAEKLETQAINDNILALKAKVAAAKEALLTSGRAGTPEFQAADQRLVAAQKELNDEIAKSEGLSKKTEQASQRRNIMIQFGD
jgi:hypothetical protein